MLLLCGFVSGAGGVKAAAPSPRQGGGAGTGRAMAYVCLPLIRLLAPQPVGCSVSSSQTMVDIVVSEMAVLWEGMGMRHRGDSNPCGQSPMDFESIPLTARAQCQLLK